MDKTCAITGANGLVGSYCVQHLRDRGHTVLRLVRNPTEPSDRIFDLSGEMAVEHLRDVDVLVHCAYEFAARGWQEIHRINVVGSIALFSAAQEAGVGKIIYISSVSAYEGCQSLYGKAKMEVERTAVELGALVVRPGLVFSEEERGMYGALYRIVGLPLLPVFSGGRQPMVLVHADDLSALVVAMTELDIPNNSPYVIAAHHDYRTFRDILTTIAQKKSVGARFVSVPGSLALVGMRLLETLGIRLPFGSDSLVGLLNPYAEMDFSSADVWGVTFRRFGGE